MTFMPCDRCVGRSLNLCKPLDDAGLQTMLSLGGIRHWKNREIIFRAGAPMGAFYKIRAGIVAVSHTIDDGRRQIVAVRGPGDCVGYLDNDGRYAFEGQALTDVEACAFDRRRFDAFTAGHPDLAAAVAEALSAALKQSGQAMLVLGPTQIYRAGGPFLGRARYPLSYGRYCVGANVAEDEPDRDWRLSWSHRRDDQPCHPQAEEPECHQAYSKR